MDDEDKPIIIGNKDFGRILFSIGLRGLVVDRIPLHFADKHAGDAEYLLRILRKSYGWEEQSREKKQTINIRCFYDDDVIQELDGTITENGKKKKIKEIRKVRICKNPDIQLPKGCNEQERMGCKGYKRKYNNTIWITEVIIEKIPQLRDI